MTSPRWQFPIRWPSVDTVSEGARTALLDERDRALEDYLDELADGGGGGAGLPPGGDPGEVLGIDSGGNPVWLTPPSGVTDHGLLIGLADDDHPQYTTDAEATTLANAAVATHAAAADPHAAYLTSAEADALFLTPAEGNAAYDALGAAAAGDAAHVAAPDPHPQYLTMAEGDAAFLTQAEGDGRYLSPAEVLQGEAIDVDLATTPGSAIVRSRQDADEWLWLAAASVAPAATRVAVNHDSFMSAATLTISRTSLNGAPDWIGWLKTGDNVVISVPRTTRHMRFKVAADSFYGAGNVAVVSIVPVAGTEPLDGERVTLSAHYAAGAGTGITQADGDTRYVNTNGDTMAGTLNVPLLTAPRIDMRNEAGSTFPTMRFYDSDANDPHFAISDIEAGPILRIAHAPPGGGASTALVDIESATNHVRFPATGGVTVAGNINTVSVVNAGAMQVTVNVNARNLNTLWNSPNRVWTNSQIIAQGDSGQGAKVSMVNPGVGGTTLGVFGSNVVYMLDDDGSTIGRINMVAAVVLADVPLLRTRTAPDVVTVEPGPGGEDFASIDTEALLLHLLARIEALEARIAALEGP